MVSSSSAEEARNLERMRALAKLPGNDTCADCAARLPRFASVTLGIFLCNRCYGIHRNVGAHITRTKCIGLDTWKASEVDFMEKMGNRNAAAIWLGSKPHDVQPPLPSASNDVMEQWIRDKYERRLYHLAPTTSSAGSSIQASSSLQTHRTGSRGVTEQPLKGSAFTHTQTSGAWQPHFAGLHNVPLAGGAWETPRPALSSQLAEGSHDWKPLVLLPPLSGHSTPSPSTAIRPPSTTTPAGLPASSAWPSSKSAAPGHQPGASAKGMADLITFD